ncbi:HlyD family efflux transporter periplasmic adaptor subunit [Pseudoalteromonas peptidolytica]|nr:HlyD family efflux transporter periplasmic adaptor subunit [Pseudoalteromonas peptidolytica]
MWRLNVDIKKEKKKSFNINNKLVFAAILLIAVVCFLYSTVNSERAIENPILSQVKRGELIQEVKGYGVLQSRTFQQVSAPVDSTIERVILKPGAKVDADSIIMELSSPELSRQVEKAKLDVFKLVSEKQKMANNHRREMLDEKERNLELEMQYQQIKLKKVAESNLYKDGIISSVDYKQTELQAEQLKQRLVFSAEKIEQLALVQKEELSFMEKNISFMEAELKALEQKQRQLLVRAGQDGVLQALNAEVGQRLSIGENIALVGSTSDLVAMIKVPQGQADKVAIGQGVNVGIRSNTVIGKVIRIDPVVTDNTVLIEVALELDEKSGARPQLSVDAAIIINKKEQAYFIDKPNYLKHAKASRMLYKLDEGGKRVSKEHVNFGIESDNYIELLPPVSLDDRFLISEISSFDFESFGVK